jgi:hypothetical protein
MNAMELHAALVFHPTLVIHTLDADLNVLSVQTVLIISPVSTNIVEILVLVHAAAMQSAMLLITFPCVAVCLVMKEIHLNHVAAVLLLNVSFSLVIK